MLEVRAFANAQGRVWVVVLVGGKTGGFSFPVQGGRGNTPGEFDYSMLAAVSCVLLCVGPRSLHYS